MENEADIVGIKKAVFLIFKNFTRAQKVQKASQAWLLQQIVWNVFAKSSPGHPIEIKDNQAQWKDFQPEIDRQNANETRWSR